MKSKQTILARALSLIAVGVLATTTLTAGPVAAATAGTAGTVTIEGKCLDVRDFGTANGTVIQIFDCNGSTAQNWTWEDDGTVRIFGKCLDVTGASNANGALLQLYTCVEGVPQQKFSALPDGTIYSTKSAKCLASQGTIANFARVGLAPCDPAKAEQKWTASTASGAKYTLTGGAAQVNAYGTDTPGFPYIDKDGTFYTQQAHSLYSKQDPREWKFYTGANYDSVLPSTLNDAIDPANTVDKNNDTTWRCNNSPTGSKATYAPTASQENASYSERNYCVLAGVWVDPDTGDWYGMVHNEMTPEPFGDGMHYDAIDYAVSKDQGKTWKIAAEVLTSPFSTTRGDTVAFPAQNYYYGDGDQRLFVDNASGYFYVFYASRTIAKPGVQGGQSWLQHVARAPISQKMAPASWRKWYDGTWQEPGVGGRESNIIPADGGGTGYTAPADDYKPSATGSQPQQVAAGTLPDDSQLAVMNVAWNAYLGMYIGTPQNNVAQDTGTKTPLHFYGTRDLATQKWVDLGLVPTNKNGAWYRWFVDSGSRTSTNILGKTFRSYCTVECSTYWSEFSETTIEPASAAGLPAPPVNTSTNYRITNTTGQALAQTGSSVTVVPSATASTTERWRFTSTADGFFTITNVNSGQALGVNASGNAGRAWGAQLLPQALASAGDAKIGQQWSFQRVVTTPVVSGAVTPTNEYRLVNRYSGLAISFSSTAAAQAVTSPIRQWEPTTGAVDPRTSGAQRLAFVAG